MSLSHLIHAGISVGDALMLLYEDEQDPFYKALPAYMARLGDSGCPLEDTFRSTGKFPAYVCTLLTVGEQVDKTIDTATHPCPGLCPLGSDASPHWYITHRPGRCSAGLWVFKHVFYDCIAKLKFFGII